MIHFLTTASADWTLHEYLSRWGRGVAHRFRIVHYEDLPRMRSLEPGTYVLSALCALTPELRGFLEELHGRLEGKPGFRLLNHPTRTRTRFDLLEELARRGSNDFRAVRATGDFGALRYPVFLRSERTHGGTLSSLLRSPREVERAVGRAVLRGREIEDLLVVEFCDTADPRGLYRKYSAFVVGGRVLPRTMECGPDWMVKHTHSLFSREILEEERAYVAGNPHESELARIFTAAGADYGRIDYAVRDGRVQTWEINLHPTIGRGPHPDAGRVPGELEPYREETKKYFYGPFQSAWEAVDVDAAGAPAVDLRPSIREARPPPGGSFPEGGPPLLRRIAARVAGPLLPAIGRRAVRKARRRTP